MSAWKERKLGEVASFSYGKMPDKNRVKEIGVFPIFSGYQITGYYDEYNSDEDLIIVARGVGGTGNVKISPKHSYVTNLSIIAKLDCNIVDKKYIYYNYLINNLRYLDSGSAQSQITISDLQREPIIFPPLPEQRAIASVLSSLDDKIDLLHRQNKTLEAMAEVVFRYFFVDNRKAFWQECTVSKLADHEKISINPNRNPNTLFYHYSISAFDEMQMPICELGSLIQSNKYKVTKNKILFSKLNPHKDKRVWLIPSSIPENSICSTEFQVLNPKAEEYLPFLYCFISHPGNYDEIAAGVGGTSSSHQRIDPEVLFKFKCFLPDDTTLTSYNEMVKPIFEKIHHNRESMQAIIRLRDLLLPKLMSGEVRVKL